MPRSLPALVLAAAVAAAVTYYLVAPSPPDLLTPNLGEAAVAERATLTRPAATGIAERADIYRAAGRANGADIVSLLEAAAGLPPSPERSFKLGVLLARYAEIDAENAIAAARSVGASNDVVATLFAQWATKNPAAALAALGGDDYAVRQIAAALPKRAARMFLVGAVAAVAATDPAGALAQALALNESGLSGPALQRLAAVLVEQDPRAAVARADAINDPDLRVSLQGSLFREWALRDVDGVFDYFGKLDGDTQARLASAGALRDAARLDPVRTLEVIRELPAAIRTNIESTAVGALAQRDLDAAVQYVDRLPVGEAQQWPRQAVARIYGKRDPDAALAWARGTGLRENLIGVLGGIATTDAQRALDALKTLSPNDRFRAMGTIATEMVSDRSADPGRIAEQLLVDADPNVNAMLSTLLASWSRQSLPSALAWVMGNSDRLRPEDLKIVAQTLAWNDVTAGEQYLAQLPSEARFAWIQGLAQGRVQNDPRAAAAWVERLRQDPAYASAAVTVAQGLARLDAPAAGKLIAGIENLSASDAQALGPAPSNIGTTWARTNPLAAAEWARDLRVEEWRSTGVRSVVGTWAESDSSAAKSWALRLPAGSLRDGALGSLLAASTKSEPDAELLRAYSSDEARQQGLLGVVFRLTQRDLDAARSVSHRLSGQQREQADQAIARTEGQRRGVSPVFFSN